MVSSLGMTCGFISVNVACHICHISWISVLYRFPSSFLYKCPSYWLECEMCVLLKDFGGDFRCSYPICQDMDAIPHWRCRECPWHANCVWRVWCIFRRPRVQYIIPGHPFQYSVQDPLEFHEKRREWGWMPYVATVSWRDRLHGRWVCNCCFKVSFNFKHYISPLQKAYDLQLLLFLEMPLGLQEEASFRDFCPPWWSLNSVCDV